MTDKEKLEKLREFLTDQKGAIADVMVQIADSGEGDDIVPIEKATKFMDYSLLTLVIMRCMEIIDDKDYKVREMMKEIDEMFASEDDDE